MKIDKISLISDNIHGTIRLSQIEMRIISSPIFNRLHDVSQNSTAYLTFPTNRTKRFEHSIGTMFLAGEIFRYSIMNAEDNTRIKFLDELNSITENRISQLLGDRNTPYKSTIGDANYKKTTLTGYADFIDGIKIINEWIPYNVTREYQYTYHALLQSVRIAGLMHDVGHPPFSHITESAMKSLWQRLSGEMDLTKMQTEFCSALDSYFENEGALHEKIGNQITHRLFESMQDNMPKDRGLSGQLLPEHFYIVMVNEMTMAILNESTPFFARIHSIISGAVDADRLDYVTRDVRNSGLNSGSIEYDRLIPRMKLISNDDTDGYYFCPSIKCIGVLEDFFNRRWNLYRKIIFHHRVIKTDYLLRNCVSELLMQNLLESIPSKSDNEYLPADISGLWKAVEWNPSDEIQFNRLIQWDDGWLMSILKKEFLKRLDGSSGGDPSALQDKLRELVASEKHYYSLIKNAEMFTELEAAAIKEMQSHLDTIKDDVSDLQSRSRSHGLVINYFLHDVSRFTKFIEYYVSSLSYSLEKGFALGEISRIIFELYLGRSRFNHLVETAVSDIEDNDIIDTVVEFKPMKSGMQDNFYVYSGNNDMKLFEKVSKTTAELRLQMKYMLPFYIYVNPKNPDYLNDTELRKRIGANIGSNICNEIRQYLGKLKQKTE